MPLKRLLPCLLVTGLPCLAAIPCHADTLEVPGDHATIQGAINAGPYWGVWAHDGASHERRVNETYSTRSASGDREAPFEA